MALSSAVEAIGLAGVAHAADRRGRAVRVVDAVMGRRPDRRAALPLRPLARWCRLRAGRRQRSARGARRCRGAARTAASATARRPATGASATTATTGSTPRSTATSRARAQRVRGQAIGLSAHLRSPLRVWSQSTGLVRCSEEGLTTIEDDGATDSLEILKQIHRADEPGVWLLEDFQPFLREENNQVLPQSCPTRRITRSPGTPGRRLDTSRRTAAHLGAGAAAL
jgi:hypothetical protein